MNKYIDVQPFVKELFDEQDTVEQAAEIIQAILTAHSPRLSDLAREMKGKAEANYKRIQRFLGRVDPRMVLGRLYQENAPFVIGDPTEMARPQAYKTGYVGKLSDSETYGYWLFLLATPYRGRALPCGVILYSSNTIRREANSRNLNHFRAFGLLKDMIGEKPLVLDREFSYLELLENLVTEQINFVIRLQLGAHPPTFYDGEGQIVIPAVARGETRILNKVFYKGRVFVNLIGVWHSGFEDPLWVMTNLKAEDALAIYLQRMKIEQTFRDLKTLLRFDKLMNKCQDQLEKMVALVLIAYTFGVLLGEAIRDRVFKPDPAPQPPPLDAHAPFHRPGYKYKRFSGLFILVRFKLSLSQSQIRHLADVVLADFHSALLTHVRSPV
jgi:hypothetical protein